MEKDSLLPKRCQRLKELRGDRTQKEMSALLGVTEKTYRSWEKGEYRKGLTEKTYPQPDLEHLIKMSEIFHCSIDYLLHRSNFHSPENDFIGSFTGLSDKAIETIKSIKQESENWVSDWERYKNIKHSDNSEFNYPGYNDLSALNFMMEYSGILSNILRGLQDLLHNDYKIPVHLENEKFVIPDNSYEYFSEQYYLLLARSKQMPDDNVPLLLDESFFHSIALKKIEHSFLELLNLYQENQKEDLK